LLIKGLVEQYSRTVEHWETEKLECRKIAKLSCSENDVLLVLCVRSSFDFDCVFIIFFFLCLLIVYHVYDRHDK